MNTFYGCDLGPLFFFLALFLEQYMDSLTQAALGGALGGAVLGSRLGRGAIVGGALLATLPDLDVLIDYGDAVANFSEHRGFSHSLLVLAPLATLLAWAVLGHGVTGMEVAGAAVVLLGVGLGSLRSAPH